MHMASSGSEAEDPLRHAATCSGCLSWLPQEVGLSAGLGEGTELR